MSFSRLQWSSCWVGQLVMKSFPGKSFLLVALQWQQPTVRAAKLLCWRVFEQHADFLRVPWLLLCSCPWPLTSAWRTATEKREGSSIAMIFPGFLLAQSLNRSLACGKLQAGGLFPVAFSSVSVRWGFWSPLLLIVAKVPNCCSCRIQDVMRPLMKINALLSWGPYLLRLRVWLIWLFMIGLVAQNKKKEEANQADGALVPNSAVSPGCCCCWVRVSLQPFPLLLLIVVCESEDGRLQTSRVKMSWASKVVREGVLVGQFSARWGMWLAGPQLARAMVSMTCSSLPRSRCLRDCSSFCNAERIWTQMWRNIRICSRFFQTGSMQQTAAL